MLSVAARFGSILDLFRSVYAFWLCCSDIICSSLSQLLSEVRGGIRKTLTCAHCCCEVWKHLICPYDAQGTANHRGIEKVRSVRKRFPSLAAAYYSSCPKHGEAYIRHCRVLSFAGRFGSILDLIRSVYAFGFLLHCHLLQELITAAV